MQYDTIAKTLASLVNTNDGNFKTKKQASFILSKCDNGIYEVTRSVYNNPYTTTYYCNKIGVYKVERYTKKQGNKTAWVKGQKTEYKLRQAELAKESQRLKTAWTKEKQHLMTKIEVIKAELNKPETSPFMINILQDMLDKKEERLKSIVYSLDQ